MTILMTAVFILGRQAMIITIYIGYKISMQNEKSRINKGRSQKASYDEAKNILQNEYKDMKKERLMLVFAIIAVVTTILYFFNWEAIVPGNKTILAMNDGILYAFSLYTGFEAVVGKWKDRKGIS